MAGFHIFLLGKCWLVSGLGKQNSVMIVMRVVYLVLLGTLLSASLKTANAVHIDDPEYVEYLRFRAGEYPLPPHVLAHRGGFYRIGS